MLKTPVCFPTGRINSNCYTIFKGKELGPEIKKFPPSHPFHGECFSCGAIGHSRSNCPLSTTQGKSPS